MGFKKSFRAQVTERLGLISKFLDVPITVVPSTWPIQVQITGLDHPVSLGETVALYNTPAALKQRLKQLLSFHKVAYKAHGNMKADPNSKRSRGLVNTNGSGGGYSKRKHWY